MKSLIAVFSKGKGGFTIAETLIVVLIMTVLSTILLSGSRTSNDQIALSTAQATVAGVLNRAKSLTIAKWNPDPAQSVCGFGVHFSGGSSNTYILYQDVASGGNCARAYMSGTEIETFTLDKRVSFALAIPMDIEFLAPYLETVGAGTITLQLDRTGQTASVEVTSGGSVTAL